MVKLKKSKKITRKKKIIKETQEVIEKKQKFLKLKKKLTKFKYNMKIFHIRNKTRVHKFKLWIKNLLDVNDKKMIKSYLIYASLQGLIVNIALLNFGFNIGFISILSYGSLLWLFEIKLIRFWRRLFFKNPNEPKL